MTQRERAEIAEREVMRLQKVIEQAGCNLIDFANELRKGVYPKGLKPQEVKGLLFHIADCLIEQSRELRAKRWK